MLTDDTIDAVVSQLRDQARPENLPGMARYGIDVSNALGVQIPVLRALAKTLKKRADRHTLAEKLWATRIHEARLLAAFVDNPAEATEEQAERWAGDFRSWDLCDQVCGNLFDRLPFARRKAKEWCEREEEFVKRAGFVLMAQFAVHDKKAPDTAFEELLPFIERGASDERNVVKKAVSWALRQIGKRNATLLQAARGAALRIKEQNARSARWIASDALREFERRQTKKSRTQ